MPFLYAAMPIVSYPLVMVASNAALYLDAQARGEDGLKMRFVYRKEAVLLAADLHDANELSLNPRPGGSDGYAVPLADLL